MARVQALGCLAKGNNLDSFLSSEALEKVLGVLQGSAKSASGRQKDALFEFLEQCLFSSPVWKIMPTALAAFEEALPDQLLLTQLVYAESEVSLSYSQIIKEHL